MPRAAERVGRVCEPIIPSPRPSATARRVLWTALVVAAGALPARGANPELVSQSASPASSTITANGETFVASMSADGRWLALVSEATNLVPGQVDANGGQDVFVWDRLGGGMTLVSGTPGIPPTVAADGHSSEPTVSADGRWVAFASSAGNLGPGGADPANSTDVFLWDRFTDTTSLVSHRFDSVTGSAFGLSARPSISADGRYVAYWSFGSALVDGQSGGGIFLWDRDTNVNVMVSHVPGSPATGGNGTQTDLPAISEDGRFVAYVSTSTDLVAGQVDAGSDMDLFLWDRTTDTTTLVSRTAASAVTAAGCTFARPAMSADGRYLAFESEGTDLAAGQADANGFADVFLWDRVANAMTLVSHTAGSPLTTPAGASISTAVSRDGRFVAFGHSGTDLVPGQVDANLVADIFLWDRTVDATTLVSRVPGASTTAANGRSAAPRVSDDGATVAFLSLATDLVPGQVDANGSHDVFVHHLPSGTTRLASRLPATPPTAGNGSCFPPILSAEGRFAAFNCTHSDLVASDTNDAFDAFLFTNPFPGSYFTVFPCRLADTRATGPALASGVTATLDVHHICQVSETATSVAVNVTVTEPTGGGHLTLHPADLPPGVTSTINFGPGQTRANNAVLRLSADGELAVTPVVAGNGSVHVIIDVVGFFD